MLWKVFDRQSPANTNWHLIIRNTCSTLLRMEDLRCSIYRSQFIPLNNFIHDLKKFFSSCLLFTTAVLNVSKRSLFHFFYRPYLLALLYHILSFRSWFRFNQRFLRIRLKAQAAFPQIRDGISCTAHSPWRSGHRASPCRSSDAYP